MKMIKFLSFAIISTLLFASCNTEDDSPIDDGDPLPPNILASLYATSNTSDDLVVFDFTPTNILTRILNTGSNDSEGIYYDEDTDEVVINSRSQATVNVYSNVTNVESGANLSLLMSSTPELESPRDIAVSGDVYVVSDNADVDGDPNTDDGRFFIFQRDENGISLRNTVTVDFAVWGIEFIGTTLFAVVDKTADVASFNNFVADNTIDATVAPSKRITIEGIVRTHGIAEDDGFVILTDIGDAENVNDGGFHFISGFISKFNATDDDGTLAFAGNQVRVSGNLTELGNPVSVDYDNERQTIFIAERANEGGKILYFTETGAGGNLIPNFSTSFEGASSVFFNDN